MEHKLTRLSNPLPRLAEQTPACSRSLFLLILFFFSPGANAESGNFEKLFVPSQQIKLEDPKLNYGSLFQAKIGSSGRILVIDWEVGGEGFRGLKIFSREGRLRRVLNVPSTQSNEIIKEEKFYDVVEDGKGSVFSTTSYRLVVFDSSGIMRQTYPLGKWKESDSTLEWRGSNVERLALVPSGGIVGAGIGYPAPFHCLHAYDGSGKLLREFLPLDTNYLRSRANTLSVAVDSLGDVWCTFPYFYKVFHLSVSGVSKKDIIGKSLTYKAPDNIEGPSTPRSRKKWLKWMKSWTPVVDCATTKNGYVLLVMLAGEKGKTFLKRYDPEGDLYAGGFFLDLYDRDGNMISGGLHTPHRFLCVDNKDNFWFALAPGTPENPPKNGPVILGKYKLNVKPATPGKTAPKAGR